MTPGPETDDDVPAYWQALGLPGLIDSHLHFMPESVTRKVWAYFEAAGPLIGREWPIRYAWPEAERLAYLRKMGVRAFPSLVYAHKPGMAAWLNSWAREFAAVTPEVIPTATIFPEPDVTSYLDTALRAGVRVIKVHVQVGGFDPRDPMLDQAWGMLADARVPVVLHAGSGPTAGEFTGPGPVAEVLARHPGLCLVMAHMGMPEYDEFIGFAERYERVYLDTTMCFTDFAGGRETGRRVAPRLAALREKVLLGTDFPTIPYAYAHQLEVLADLGLGDEWMRAVCWSNAAELFEVSEPAPAS
ncbi:MAG TPA: amidohydrolase family protein [Mycobacteriales bacterium]|nr:amidohydrolase family protein [Mycobacteriales bacterium]